MDYEFQSEEEELGVIFNYRETSRQRQFCLIKTTWSVAYFNNATCLVYVCVLTQYIVHQKRKQKHYAKCDFNTNREGYTCQLIFG